MEVGGRIPAHGRRNRGGKRMGSLGRLAVRSGGRWVVEFGLWKTYVGDHSPLSLAGDAWPAAAPGGVAGERERARQRGSHGSERESERSRGRESRVPLRVLSPGVPPPLFVLISFFFFDN